MHVKEIYVIFIHLFDSGILLILDIGPAGFSPWDDISRGLMTRAI
jgi:hypothetical protein